MDLKCVWTCVCWNQLCQNRHSIWWLSSSHITATFMCVHINVCVCMHMHLNIFLMQYNRCSDDGLINCSHVWEKKRATLIPVLQVRNHSDTDMLRARKKAQKHTCMHTKICSAWVDLNNQSYFTSSVCRWAWLLRWGTGGTRWHRPDTEQPVLLHLCYLQGAERQSGQQCVSPVKRLTNKLQDNECINVNFPHILHC